MKKFVALISAIALIATANAEYYDYGNYDYSNHNGSYDSNYDSNYGCGYTDCRQSPCLSPDMCLGAVVVVGAIAAVVVASGGHGSHKSHRHGHL